MQETLHKHLKTIFIVLLVVVGVSFVGTVGRSPGLVSSAREIKPLDYYGYNLRSARDIEFLRKAALFSSQVHTGLPPLSEEQLETLIHMRPALLWIADRLAIPAPTEQQMREFLMTRPLFQGDGGAFEESRYRSFIESAEKDTLDVLLVLEQDYRMQAVQRLMEGPGYALDYESRRILEIAHTRWSIEDATLDMRNFNPDIKQDQATLEAYYEANASAYVKKKQVKTQYVLFSPDAYMDQVPAPDPELVAKTREKDFKGDEGLSHAQISDHIRREQAKTLAQEAAYGFQYTLFDKHISYKSAAFKDLLREKKLTLRELPPLEPGQRIPELPVVDSKALTQLFDLDAKQYYSNPVNAGGFFAVFFLEAHLPERAMTFDEAQTLVAEDHRKEELAERFEAKGEALHEALKADLAADPAGSFESLARAQGLEVKSYENFSLEEPPATLSHNTFDRLQFLNPGDLSAFFVEGNTGHILYVVQKLLPETVEHEETFAHIQDYQDHSASRLRSTATMRHLMKPAFEQ